MADEGPTLVGSIVAELDISTRKWDVSVTEIKAQAAEIGALNPTVKVDANVGAALSQMAMVGAAADELDHKEQEELVTKGRLNNALIDEGIQRKHAAADAKYEADQVLWNNSALKKQIDARNAVKQGIVDESFATDKLASAQRSLRIAEANLASVNKDSTSTLQRKLSAQNAVASATRQVEAETAKAAAAVEADTAAGEDNISVNRRRVSGLQVLIALAPAILAAAAPVASAAVGLGVAFGVMGGAGVLAVMGIKNAMAQGTATGQAYGNGLGALKGDLDQLAQTSAVRMLDSFQSAVGDINSHMPFLNQLIGDASGALGQMGGTALTGVLNGLQAMNPLIQAGEVELSKLVGWLSGFSSATGFSEFVSYAVANLPSVTQLIEGLVTTAGHILAAFAPLGPEVLGFLNGVVDVLNVMPLPVLAGMVTMATTLGPAMQIAFSRTTAALIKGVADAIAYEGIMTELAVPVIGILLAAMAGVAVAAASSVAPMGQATTVMVDYTSALKEDNDALGVNVRATAAKALQDAGAYDAALKLGISQQLLTDDLLGVAGAHAQVAAKMAENQGKIDAATQATSGYIGATTDNTTAQDGFVGAMNTVNSALDGNNKQIQSAIAASKNIAAATTDQSTAVSDLAARYGMTTSQYQDAIGAQQQAKTATENQTRAMQIQNDAAGLLKQAWDQLNGKTISAAQAQNTFDSSLVNMGDHMTATGKKVTFTTTSIKDQSAASVSLRGQLVNQVTAMEGVVEANGGVQKMTAASRGEYVKMRQQIIDNAVAHGVNRDAVTAFIDTIYKIPPLKLTQTEMDTADAMAKAHAMQAYIDSMHGTTLTNRIYSIYSEQHVSTGQGGSGGQTRSEGGPIYRANGGPVGAAQYLASGGYSDGPIGTDTVRAWLSPGEMVIRRASAESIGQPALNYMNQTGKLPPSGQNITVYVTNPFTGEQVQAVVRSVATQAAGNVLKSAVHDAKNRRS